MKYWLFDGKDAQGPYDPEELKRIPGFGSQSLICPDGADTADQWRPSQFYLIKPPPTKAELARPSRGPAAVSHGMGRIAEAGLVDEAPAPIVGTPPRQPLPERRRFSSAALLTFAVAAASAAGAYVYLNRQKLMPKPALPPVPVATTPVPAPAAAAPTLTEAQIQEAEGFVQGFKTQSPGRRLPVSPAEILSPQRWRQAQTVGEALTMKSLVPLGAAATALLEKQGLGMKAGERELRKNAKRWAAYSEHFMRNAAVLSWDVKRSKSCPTQSAATGEPTCFEVTALLRSQRGGPQEEHAFVADLTARTLKALDSNAWLDLDPRGLASWGRLHIALGEPIDEEAVAAQSTVYGIPLEHHRHVARHASVIPEPEAKEPEDLGPPTPKDAHASASGPADGGLDYTEPGAKEADKQPPKAQAAAGSDEQVLEKALLDGGSEQNAGQHAQAAPQPAPASGGDGERPAVPPGLEHAVSQPAQAQAQPQAQAPAAQPATNSSGNGAGGKPKSAMDMSVDELRQYLNRDGSSTP